MDKRKFISMSAAMEGESVIAKNLGKKKKVSEMELIILCNFAKIGVLECLSREPKVSVDEIREEIDVLVDAIKKTFSDEKRDGISRLSQSCVGVLASERFEKYILGMNGESSES